MYNHGVGLRTRSRSFPEKEDSDSTPLRDIRCSLFPILLRILRHFSHFAVRRPKLKIGERAFSVAVPRL